MLKRNCGRSTIADEAKKTPLARPGPIAGEVADSAGRGNRIRASARSPDQARSSWGSARTAWAGESRQRFARQVRARAMMRAVAKGLVMIGLAQPVVILAIFEGVRLGTKPILQTILKDGNLFSKEPRLGDEHMFAHSLMVSETISSLEMGHTGQMIWWPEIAARIVVNQQQVAHRSIPVHIGGDQIALVSHVKGVSQKDAAALLLGQSEPGTVQDGKVPGTSTVPPPRPFPAAGLFGVRPRYG
jgi:hypothetical protein